MLPSHIISTMTVRKMLRRQCMGYLAYVIDTIGREMQITDIPIVRKFIDVFPENLPGLPLNREIEFEINLISRMAPISRAPYRTTPTEWKELKVRLEELVDKGFVISSVSP